MDIAQWIYKIGEYGLEVASKRYYSKYQGYVTDTADPQQQGRVKVIVKQLGIGSAHARWAYPSAQFAGNNYGSYFPPEKNDVVWVWFDHGDPTRPNFSGSWWLNKDSHKPKTSITSEVPVEFREGASNYTPTKRGIKTKRGHGLGFEDGLDADADAKTSKVEFWSGTQPAGNVSATKNRYLRMQDSPADKKTIVIASTATPRAGATTGHQTEWRDAVGEIWVRTHTAGGHKFFMDDTGKQILLKSTNGNKVLIDDVLNDITIQTIGNHKVVLSDSQKSIRAVSTGLNSVTLDDTLKGVAVETAGKRSMLMYDTPPSTTLTTPTGQVVTQSPAGTSVVDTGNVTVLAGGVLGLTGTGVSVTSAGGGPSLQTATGPSTSNFTGDKNESFQGKLTQVIQGFWTITSGFTSILSALGVEIGSPGTKYALVDERFLATFLAHVHTTTIIGAPTGPPFWLVPPPDLPIAGAVTTVTTSAN